MPVVTSSRRLGRRSSSPRGNGVRSRIATTTSKRREPRDERVLVVEVVAERGDLGGGAEPLPVGPQRMATSW